MSLRTRTDYMGALAAVVVAVVLAYVLIGRNWILLRQQRAEIDLLSAQSETLTTLATALQEAEAALQAARAQESITQRVPEQMDYASFFQELQQQATTRFLKVQRLTHGATTDDGEVASLPITFAGSGSFENIYLFLHDLREISRLVKLEQFTVRATEDPGACEVEMIIRIYATAPPEPEAAV